MDRVPRVSLYRIVGWIGFQGRTCLAPCRIRPRYSHSARADMCRRLGRTAEARSSYRKALALTQQEPERQFPQQRIRQLKEIVSTTCRIPVRPFDYMVKAGQPIRHKLFPGRYATRKIRKSRVDSRLARSTSVEHRAIGYSQLSERCAVQAPI